MTDPRIPLAAVLDQAGNLITSTDPARAGDPTPCDEFDVATLIAHMTAIPTRVAHIAGGGDAFDVPSVLTDLEPADWATRWREARDRVDAALTDDDVLTREFRAPFGTVPGAAALGSYVTEFLIHGWDLAQATGRLAELDQALAERVAAVSLPTARRAIPADVRGQIPFGPVVEVPEDAGAFAQLLGWYGRDPRGVGARP